MVLQELLEVSLQLRCLLFPLGFFSCENLTDLLLTVCQLLLLAFNAFFCLAKFLIDSGKFILKSLDFVLQFLDHFRM